MLLVDGEEGVVPHQACEHRARLELPPALLHPRPRAANRVLCLLHAVRRLAFERTQLHCGPQLGGHVLPLHPPIQVCREVVNEVAEEVAVRLDAPDRNLVQDPEVRPARRGVVVHKVGHGSGDQAGHAVAELHFLDDGLLPLCALRLLDGLVDGLVAAALVVVPALVQVQDVLHLPHNPLQLRAQGPVPLLLGGLLQAPPAMELIDEPSGPFLPPCALLRDERGLEPLVGGGVIDPELHRGHKDGAEQPA
mmetsp:Transcript_92116/g.265093  ORF Transcript_92116/g.265093 Transcript_92116/m.265093 type:complete len:250 (-) Transcript_92116:1562-2311(-)